MSGGKKMKKKYIGKLDKYNRKIYEGCILKFDWNDGKAVSKVVYDKEKNKWVLEKAQPGLFGYFQDNGEYEIIGDIFKNPELLNFESEWIANLKMTVGNIVDRLKEMEKKNQNEEVNKIIVPLANPPIKLVDSNNIPIVWECKEPYLENYVIAILNKLNEVIEKLNHIK